jgi:hypothetical protein
MEAVAGAYPSGTTMVRCRREGSTMAFEAVEVL